MWKLPSRHPVRFFASIPVVIHSNVKRHIFDFCDVSGHPQCVAAFAVAPPSSEQIYSWVVGLLPAYVTPFVQDSRFPREHAQDVLSPTLRFRFRCVLTENRARRAQVPGDLQRTLCASAVLSSGTRIRL